MHVIYDGLHGLLDKLAPDLMVLEDLYTEYRFPRTALLMAHARGVVCLAAGQRGVAVLTLAPAEVKRAVAANGAASKEQVQHCVEAAPAGWPSCRDRRTWPTPWRWRSRATCAREAGRDDRVADGTGAAQARGSDRPRVRGHRVRGVPAADRAAAARAGPRRRRRRGRACSSLVTHYHATRDQPRPVLIGFTAELDKEFFERLITVKDMGPMVAARALAAPVGEIAAAIARQDEKYLRSLPGIGPQKAKNIVAQLQGKVAKFALARDGEPTPAPAPPTRRRPTTRSRRWCGRCSSSSSATARPRPRS